MARRWATSISASKFSAHCNLPDDGYFFIYDSANSPATSSPAVFQSAYMDTLVEGQNLSGGMQLTTNDSAYSAKMEKGGLVLFLNSLGQQAPPYWIIPLWRESSSLNLTLNEAIHSAPCNDPRNLPLIYLETDSRSRASMSSSRAAAPSFRIVMNLKNL